MNDYLVSINNGEQATFNIQWRLKLLLDESFNKEGVLEQTLKYAKLAPYSSKENIKNQPIYN